MKAVDIGRINPASVLAITALIFLFLVVFGLGRPAFAADYMKATPDSSRGAGVTEQRQTFSQS